MDVAHRATADELAVLRMAHQAVDFNPPRLGALVAGDDPSQYSRWHN
jgi:hypothetical protein